MRLDYERHDIRVYVDENNSSHVVRSESATVRVSVTYQQWSDARDELVAVLRTLLDASIKRQRGEAHGDTILRIADSDAEGFMNVLSTGEPDRRVDLLAESGYWPPMEPTETEQ